MVGRKPFGPVVAVARGDIGTVLGDRPPAQQLFELGNQQNLPGYLDKEFAGTRAAVARLGLQPDSTGALVPVSRATDGARASVTAGLRFFGGALFIGGTRPVDHAATWKGLVSFGQQW